MSIWGFTQVIFPADLPPFGPSSDAVPSPLHLVDTCSVGSSSSKIYLPLNKRVFIFQKFSPTLPILDVEKEAHRGIELHRMVREELEGGWLRL